MNPLLLMVVPVVLAGLALVGAGVYLVVRASQPNRESIRVGDHEFNVTTSFGVVLLGVLLVALPLWRAGSVFAELLDAPGDNGSPATSTTTEPTDDPVTPDRAVLNWLEDGSFAVIDGGTAKPDELVVLQERFPGDPPDRLTVHQVIGPIAGQALEGDDTVEVTTFPVVRHDRNTVRSERPWRLPRPLTATGVSTFGFRDADGNSSGLLTVADLAVVTPAADTEAEDGIIQVQGSAEVEVPIEVRFPTDPEVTLTPLLPWAEDDRNLITHVRGLLEELSEERDLDPDAAMARFVERYEAFLPANPPRGWRVGLTPDRMSADAGDRLTARLFADTPSEGQVLMAVLVEEVDGDRIAASPLFGLDVRDTPATPSPSPSPTDGAPVAAITTPAEDATGTDTRFQYDGFDEQRQLWYADVELAGTGSDREDGELSGGALVWRTDRDDLQEAVLGTGRRFVARLYSDRCEGLVHTVTLTVTDSARQEAADTRQIRIWSIC